MPIQFANGPALLLLIPLFAVFWRFHRLSVTDMSAGRKRLALALRCLLATLLVLALAGMRLVKQGDSLAVLFLVDGSRSIRPDQTAAMEKYLREAGQGMRAVDKVGVITFAKDPHTQSPTGQPLDPARLQDPGIATATNIAQALRHARNELLTTARDSGKRIVLLSDGNETVGRALAEAPELAADRIVLDTVTLPAALKREALVDKLVLPSRVKIGEPFQARVVVSSLTAQPATVSLLRDGKPFGAAKRVNLHRGKNVVTFEASGEKKGFYRYEARLDAEQDSLPENNRGESFAWVQGKPTVLYVADDPAMTEFLRRSLRGQNIEIEYVPPDAMPTTAAALQKFDSVFLSNARADYFTQSQLNAMQIACRDFGVGFGMVGGEDSFGLGGYRRTVVEEMLPVSMEIRKMQRFPPVCVALVIDRSGSMMESSGGAKKLDLAIEAASRAVEALKPSDKVAVIAFDADATVQVPLTPVENVEAIIGATRSIGIGGGTSVYAGAAKAYEVIKDDETPIRHIILLTDGVSNDPDYRPLVAEMKKRKITVTGVVIGSGPGGTNPGTLAWLANQTGGRFYTVQKARDIPGIYLQEIERISSRPIVEEPFLPIPTEGADARMPGINWNGMPPLLGYNVAIPKPTADVVLVSPRKDPIFATWRYGLGRSVAFLSDDRAKWAAQWLGWEGYGKFWAQAVRWTLRPFSPSDYQTQVTLEGDRGHIVVDALDDKGQFVNRLQLRARIAGPGAAGKIGEALPETPLRQTAPGRYEGWFDAPQMGTYLVNILQKPPGAANTVSTVVGLSLAYAPEYRATEANRYLMRQLAEASGGKADPAPRAAFGQDRPGVWTAADLSPTLLLLAMLLLPFDIAVRRLAVDIGDARRALARAFRRETPQPKTRAATPELDRLLDRKEAASALRVEEVPAFSAPAETPAAPALREPIAAAAPTLSTPSRRQTSSSEPTSSTVPITPELAASSETPPPAAPAGEGFSRLMAAKRRAQERRPDRE